MKLIYCISIITVLIVSLFELCYATKAVVATPQHDYDYANQGGHLIKQHEKRSSSLEGGQLVVYSSEVEGRHDDLSNKMNDTVEMSEFMKEAEVDSGVAEVSKAATRLSEFMHATRLLSLSYNKQRQSKLQDRILDNQPKSSPQATLLVHGKVGGSEATSAHAHGIKSTRKPLQISTSCWWSKPSCRHQRSVRKRIRRGSLETKAIVHNNSEGGDEEGTGGGGGGGDADDGGNDGDGESDSDSEPAQQPEGAMQADNEAPFEAHRHDHGAGESAASTLGGLENNSISSDNLQNKSFSSKKPRKTPTCTTMDDIQSRFPSLSFRIIVLCLYGIVYTIGWFGNAITLIAMFKDRPKGDKPMPVINIFIANLAISDMIVCTFSVPITPIYLLFYGHWVFGPLFCKIIASLMSLSIYVSTFSLINIAHLRFRMIKYPHKRPITFTGAMLMNLSSWFMALLITLPYTMHVGIVPAHGDCSISFCDEQWSDPMDRFYFSVATLMLQFFLPFIAVSFFYGSVFRELRQRNRQLQQRQQLILSRRGELGTDRYNLNNNESSLITIQASEPVFSTTIETYQQPPASANQNPRSSIQAAATRRNSLQEPPTIVLLEPMEPEDEFQMMKAGESSSLSSSLEKAEMLYRHHHQHLNRGGQKKPTSTLGCSGGGDDDDVQAGHLNRSISYAPDTRTSSEGACGPYELDGLGRGPFGLAPLGAASSLNQVAMLEQQIEPESMSAPESVAGGLCVGFTNQQQARRLISTQAANANARSSLLTTTTTSISDILVLRERKFREKSKRQGQTNRKLIYMVALFAFTWLPLNLFNVINDYFRVLSRWSYVKHWFLISHLIACTSCFLNPVLYTLMNDNYREQLRRVLPSFLI